MPYSLKESIIGGKVPLNLTEARKKAKSLLEDSSEMLLRVSIPLIVFDEKKTIEATKRMKNKINQILEA
jgi:hypothetical protein